jgi:hypothetical protein
VCKRIWSFVVIVLAASASADADDITFVGVPTGVNDGQYYVMPYEISIDGVDELVTCYDIFDEVNFGDSWDADLLTVSQAAASGFFSTDPGSLSGYERVAWLDAQTYSNTAQQIGLQYAIWNVFGTAPTTAASETYEAEANAAAASGYQGFNFSDVRFIEQVGGVPGQNGTMQAFVYWTSPPIGQSNQDQGSAAPEPRPARLLLLGIVLTAAMVRASQVRPVFRRVYSPFESAALRIRRRFR